MPDIVVNHMNALAVADNNPDKDLVFAMGTAQLAVLDTLSEDESMDPHQDAIVSADALPTPGNDHYSPQPPIWGPCQS